MKSIKSTILANTQKIREIQGIHEIQEIQKIHETFKVKEIQKQSMNLITLKKSKKSMKLTITPKISKSYAHWDQITIFLLKISGLDSV